MKENDYKKNIYPFHFYIIIVAEAEVIKEVKPAPEKKGFHIFNHYFSLMCAFMLF